MKVTFFFFPFLHHSLLLIFWMTRNILLTNYDKLNFVYLLLFMIVINWGIIYLLILN